MSENSSNEIIKKLLSDMKNHRQTKPVTKSELIDKISSIDKNQVIKKLNDMNLGFLAQKISKMSDKELIEQISKNPQILGKINDYIK